MAIDPRILGAISPMGASLGSLSGLFGKGTGNNPFAAMTNAITRNPTTVAEWMGGQENNKRLEEMKALFGGMSLPDLKAIDYGQYELPPELQNMISEFTKGPVYSEDAQKKALEFMQGIGQTGTTAQAALDRSNFLRDENARSKGMREAILTGMAQRGRTGSGTDLVAGLNEAQNSAIRGNNNALQTSADLEQSRIAGNQAAGDMGYNITGQNFSRMSALDAINQYNNRMQNDNALRSWETKNENLDRRVQSDLSRNDIAQNNFANQWQRNSGIAGVLGAQGQNANNMYSNAANSYANSMRDRRNYDRDRYMQDVAIGFNVYDRLAGAAGRGTAGSGQLPNGAGNPAGSPAAPARAMGGPVTAGEKYLVGEMGPELLMSAKGLETIGKQGPEYMIPNTDGHVLSNDDSEKFLDDYMKLLLTKRRAA